MAEKMKKAPKKQLIVECALAIMRTQGDQGLTMRGVAGELGMSLSNLQYYFTNKDALLKGMVEGYFEACGKALEENIATFRDAEVRERVAALARLGLDYGGELTDMCRTFREFWAISTRNETVKECLMGYYKGYHRSLEQFFAQLTSSKDRAAKATALFLPYCEGYSITANALSEDKDQVVAMIADMIVLILQEGY